MSIEKTFSEAESSRFQVARGQSFGTEKASVTIPVIRNDRLVKTKRLASSITVRVTTQPPEMKISTF